MTNSIDGPSPALLVGSITGRYTFGDTAPRLGVDVFACRLRSISPERFNVSAPVIAEPGTPLTAAFAPFGTLHGRIARHLQDGFAVDIVAEPRHREELAARIDAYRHRIWSGAADRRGEHRFMPGEPRSVLIHADGSMEPCLVVDYSVQAAAVSASSVPVLGAPVTIGQVPGRVVRLFDVGFAVRFDTVQDIEDVERLLEAPEEWRDAVSVLHPARIDTDEGEDLSLAGEAY